MKLKVAEQLLRTARSCVEGFLASCTPGDAVPKLFPEGTASNRMIKLHTKLDSLVGRYILDRQKDNVKSFDSLQEIADTWVAELCQIVPGATMRSSVEKALWCRWTKASGTQTLRDPTDRHRVGPSPRPR